MSFNIQLGVYRTEKNAIDKKPKWYYTRSGTLKDGEDCSLRSPTILLQADFSIMANLNYVYIEEFKRYYYITDVKSVRASLVEMELLSDALMSFKDDIYQLDGIIKTQAYKHNLYWQDNNLKQYANPIIRTYSFPYGFDTRDSASYVLVVAGK